MSQTDTRSQLLSRYMAELLGEPGQRFATAESLCEALRSCLAASRSGWRRGMLVVLLALCVLFYFVTLAKLAGGVAGQG